MGKKIQQGDDIQRAYMGVLDSLYGKKLSYIDMLGILELAKGTVMQQVVQTEADKRMEAEPKVAPSYIG